MDLDTGEVIWAGKGRSKEDFKHFFEDMPEGYLSDVVAVAMDMNASYNLRFTAKLPKAVILSPPMNAENDGLMLPMPAVSQHS